MLSVNRFADRDWIEFADRIKDVQRRASRPNNMLTAVPTDGSAISVPRPVDKSIDPETGLVIATHKCSESDRGPETSICNEAATMGVKVGEKTGQVRKVLKRLYSRLVSTYQSATQPSAGSLSKSEPTTSVTRI